MQIKKTGTLYVVATPIGNLKDITLRAVEVLKMVDWIAAEDTRHSAPLLKHFSIQKPTVSLHEFNEHERLQAIISDLQKGQSIALISDAGTPLISDPGFHLVNAVKAAGMDVVPIPGPCAAIAALSASGLPTDKFTFEGFLPAKQEARKERLSLLLQETRTMIFYEAPHRLMATLQSMLTVFGQDRKAAVVRELTKLHESILTNNLEKLLYYFEMHPDEQRGEIVILVTGARKAKSTESQDVSVLDILLSELSLKQAVGLTAKITGQRKNVLYAFALERTKNQCKGRKNTKAKKRSRLS